RGGDVLTAPCHRDVRAERRDQQDRQLRYLPHQHAQQLEGRRIDPVQVLGDDEQRLALRRMYQQSAQGVERRLFLLWPLDHRRRVALAAGNRHEVRQERDHVAALAEALGEVLELAQPLVGRVVVSELGGALQLLEDRIERAVGMEGRAVVVERRQVGRGKLRRHRVGKPRLADTGLADQQHHLVLAGLRLLPAVEQQRDLDVAADQRARRARAQRLEAAVAAALADDAPGVRRRSEAFELMAAEARALEELADELPRALSDHDGARLSQRLQPGGEVGRLADHPLLALGALAEQVADDDEAGGDADAHLHGATAQREAPERVDHREAGAYGALGIVLLRPRIAEQGKHAVAHVFGDHSAMMLDDRGAAAVIGADDLAHVLGIEQRRQRGRADQVAEHQRELPPLGVARTRCRYSRPLGRLGAIERGAAMAAIPIARSVGVAAGGAGAHERGTTGAAEPSVMCIGAATRRAIHDRDLYPPVSIPDAGIPRMTGAIGAYYTEMTMTMRLGSINSHDG